MSHSVLGAAVSVEVEVWVQLVLADVLLGYDVPFISIWLSKVGDIAVVRSWSVEY